MGPDCMPPCRRAAEAPDEGRNQTVISGNQRLLMKDAIRRSSEAPDEGRNQLQSVAISGHQWSSAPLSTVGSHGSQSEVIKSQSDGHQWSSAPLSPVGSLGSQSEVIKSQSVVISGHQRHSHLWDRSDRNQRSSSRNQWSSVVISATLTCGIARIARRHWRRGTLAASHPSSLINPSPRGSRREIAARSVDLPDEACNQWLMRHRGSRREIAARSVDLPAVRSHQRPSSRNQM
jgi:hypothetical protein